MADLKHFTFKFTLRFGSFFKVRRYVIHALKNRWIKLFVPFLIFLFTLLANIIEIRKYNQNINIASPIDPATKTFILGEIDRFTPIIEERRDMDRIYFSGEDEELVIIKPTPVNTVFTQKEEPIPKIRISSIYHTIQPGDTLSLIGATYSLKQKTLLAANQDLQNADTLKIGDKILIPKEDYDSTYADKLMAKKTAKFTRTTVSSAGGIKYNSKGLPSSPASGCVRPTNYQYVSRRLTFYHRGVDMVAPTGTAIYAACSGRITTIAGGWSGGFGLHVKISQDNGDQANYAHMNSIFSNIAVGSYIAAGTYLGDVGSTGRSTGSHLHFEVLRNGRAVDYGY